jgi:hypothetical protein
MKKYLVLFAIILTSCISLKNQYIAHWYEIKNNQVICTLVSKDQTLKIVPNYECLKLFNE